MRNKHVFQLLRRPSVGGGGGAIAPPAGMRPLVVGSSSTYKQTTRCGPRRETYRSDESCWVACSISGMMTMSAKAPKVAVRVGSGNVLGLSR